MKTNTLAWLRIERMSSPKFILFQEKQTELKGQLLNGAADQESQ